MSDDQKSFKFINKKLLFNKNKLKDTLYNSLNLFDKLRLIKNFNQKNSNNRSESIFNGFSKNISQALSFAIIIIVTILAFIGYVYCAYLVIIDYSFGDHQFMKYLGWAFMISFVITGLLLMGCMIEDEDIEIIGLVILIMSVIMCLGLNLLIGFILGKLLYVIIALYQIQFSNKFKRIVDDIETDITDNYFNQIVYTPNKKVYYLHEIIQSINFEDHKNINNIDELLVTMTFNIDQFLLERDFSSFIKNDEYPNSDEREALKLLLKNDQARSLNFKQVILKLKQLEKLTQLNESQKQNELNKNQSKEKYEYLDKINQLAEQFKSQQDTADEINEKQFNSIMSHK